MFNWERPGTHEGEGKYKEAPRERLTVRREGWTSYIGCRVQGLG